MEGEGITILPLALTEKQFYLQNLFIIFPILFFSVTHICRTGKSFVLKPFLLKSVVTNVTLAYMEPKHQEYLFLIKPLLLLWKNQQSVLRSSVTRWYLVSFITVTYVRYIWQLVKALWESGSTFARSEEWRKIPLFLSLTPCLWFLYTKKVSVYFGLPCCPLHSAMMGWEENIV